MAVSYTHLDVYKRQKDIRSTIRTRDFANIAELEKILEAYQSMKAVSYTHLDVYKRQVSPLPKYLKK